MWQESAFPVVDSSCEDSEAAESVGIAVGLLAGVPEAITLFLPASIFPGLPARHAFMH